LRFCNHNPLMLRLAPSAMGRYRTWLQWTMREVFKP
jgi:hypothetical protein